MFHLPTLCWAGWEDLWYLSVLAIISVLLQETRLCQNPKLLDWQVRCQFFGKPWRSWSTRCKNKLSSPGKYWELGFFVFLLCAQQEGWSMISTSPWHCLFSLRHAPQSFKIGKTEASPQKTWECWTSEPTSSLHWEMLKLGGFFLIIWYWAGGRYSGKRVSQISLLASGNLVSCSPQI